MVTINYDHHMALAKGFDATKDRLLETAERLFAEYGIEAVSARQVALGASQRNQSAIRYHFGSKDGLIEALLARRVSEINERRREMLAEIPAGQRDLRALIGAIVYPLAERVAHHPTGRYYVRFLAHIFANRRRRDLWIDQGEEAALLRAIYQEIRRFMPDLPEAIWTERFRLVTGGIIHAMADRERLCALVPSIPHALSQGAFLSNLVDASIAMITTPASVETLDHFAREQQAKDEERANAAIG